MADVIQFGNKLAGPTNDNGDTGVNMDVKIIKLVSGEDIIATLMPSKVLLNESKNPRDFVYNLKNILQVMLIPDQRTGQATVGLIPFLPYADFKDGLPIEASKIVTMASPVKGLLDQYKQAFSNLIIPKSPLIK